MSVSNVSYSMDDTFFVNSILLGILESCLLNWIVSVCLAQLVQRKDVCREVKVLHNKNWKNYHQKAILVVLFGPIKKYDFLANS